MPASFYPDIGKSVVPVAAADQGDSPVPEAGRPVDRPEAVAVDACLLFGVAGFKIPLLFGLLKRLPCAEADWMMQQCAVPGRFEVVTYRIGQPEQVVGKTGAHPAHPSGRERMPPVKHIPLYKLRGAAPQNLTPGFVRCNRKTGARILKLVAEPVRPRTLIKCASAEQPPRQNLMWQEGVDQPVERLARGGNPDGASFKRMPRARTGGLCRADCVLPACRRRENKGDLLRLMGRQAFAHHDSYDRIAAWDKLPSGPVPRKQGRAA